VRETSKHLLGLINEVLDLAKIGAGRMDLVMIDTEVGDIVDRAVQQITPLASAKGLALRTNGASGPVLVKADETRLTQIVINLLSNAVKFTTTGDVGISYHTDQDTVEIRVRDSGPGIAEDERERIFEEFYQVEGGFSRSTGGTGLGLAIARRFARLMGGDIHVESEIGRGSEFILRLPAAHTAEGQTASDGRPSAVVLLHDDEAIARLEQDLAGAMTLTGATEPTRFAALARRELPTIVGLDALAPEHGAWRALAALQTERTTADLAVQLFARDDEAAATALDLGDFHILTKPLVLERAVDRVLGAVAHAPEALVLIADDDADVRRIFSEALVAAHCRVRSVRTGEDMLQELTHDQPAAVIIDPLNSGLEGMASLARMRMDPVFAEIPIVLLLPIELPPVDMDRLAAAVDAVVRARRAASYTTAELLRKAAGVPLGEVAGAAATGRDSS
jgi:CheY-like chemotaxis protein/anti-sigma regulatory factor (Ser/Thr protein kinase)